MSDCTHGGRDAYERPRYLKDFDAEAEGKRLLYKPRKPKWTPTSVDMSDHFADTDTSLLRTVYIKGVRYTREKPRDWDSEAIG